jgi:DNA polymerase III epsilon subunit-like protein
VSPVVVNQLKHLLDSVGGAPDDYLILDTETTGLSPSNDLVVELGWAECRSRTVRCSGGLLLNWSDGRYAPWAGDLEARLERRNRERAARGKNPHTTYAMLREQGHDPAEVFLDLEAQVAEAEATGMALVGHNLWGFDRDFLKWSHKKATGQRWAARWPRIVDTGLLEKARKHNLVLPAYQEGSLDRLYGFLARKRGRGKWNLDTACNEVYRLDLSLADAHAAEHDCLATHRLLETMRDLSET